ncbi:hypothetical protein JHK85_002453 [Glycine max]|nr:hypothetical protein JHK85_002453 [Glycine max]
MASFSPLTNFSTAPSPYSKIGFFHNPFITLRSSNALLRLSPLKVSADNEVATSASAFEEPRWIGGTWDLKQFQINGNTDWDAVIDAGRAAMIGFFMAYVVDSLTGVGVVDQMSNFFCKTLLFTAVSGILLVRKNEDIETLKKLWEEITFYDKQWQATWQDENSSTPKKD